MRLTLSSLYAVTLWVLVAGAEPSAGETLPPQGNVEISLVSTWTETPFKLNVLEAVASINESLYEPLVLRLMNIEHGERAEDLVYDEDADEISDTEFYRYALSLLPSTMDQALADLDISNKIMTPRIQAHYQYYQSQIKAAHTCEEDVVLFDSFGEEFYCDQDAAFMLRTADYTMIFEDFSFPFDRLIGSPSNSAVVYVIYGDYNSKYFRAMFYNMYHSVNAKKFNLVWRYVPTQAASKKPETLSAYGVALNLKRTDYIAIDDRGFSEEQQKNLEFGKDGNADIQEQGDLDPSGLFDAQYSDIQAVKEEDIQTLGLKVTKFINDSKNKLFDLRKLLAEFPKYAYSVSQLEYADEDLIDVELTAEESYKTFIPTGIYINNAIIAADKTDLFEILRTIKRELSFTKMFETIGLPYETSKDVMIYFSRLMLDLFQSPSRRYDFSKFSKTIVYLNDIEIDQRYSSFAPAREAYQSKPAAGQLPRAKENIHEMIFAIDLTNPVQLQYLLTFAEQVISQNIPIKIGVIPFLETSAWNDRAVSKLFGTYHELGALQTFNYLRMLNRFVNSNEPLTLLSFRALDFPYLDDSLQYRYTDNLANIYSTFGLSKEYPLIISNGIIYNFNEIDSALNQVFEDMSILHGSLRSKKIPENMKLSTFLKKNAVKIRNSALIPDTISQYKDNFIQPPSFVSFKHWQTVDFLRVVKEPYRNEALVTLNLMGSLMDPDYVQQVIELLKFSSKAKGVKIVVSDIHATTAFKELIELPTVDEQLQFLMKLSSTSINDDFQVRDTHTVIRDMFKINYRLTTDIKLVIAGRKIPVEKILTSDIISSIVQFERSSRLTGLKQLYKTYAPDITYKDAFDNFELFSWMVSYSYFFPASEYYLADSLPRISTELLPIKNSIHSDVENELLNVKIVLDPVSETAQELVSFIPIFEKLPFLSLHVHLRPNPSMKEIPVKRFYKSLINTLPLNAEKNIVFEDVPEKTLFNVGLKTTQRWMVAIKEASTDLDNLKLDLTNTYSAYGEFILRNILLEGYATYFEGSKSYPPAALPIELIGETNSDTNIMANFGYFQLKANPGMWKLQIKERTKGAEIFNLPEPLSIGIVDLDGTVVRPVFEKNWGMETVNLVEPIFGPAEEENLFTSIYLKGKELFNNFFTERKQQADINIFTVASGHLYERFLGIMISSVMKQTTHTVKFWLIENYMSPDFKKHLPVLAEHYGFEYELVMYNWPIWLAGQRERQRTIWGYKILFLDVLFPQDLDKIIFVDSDQIIRTDLKELVDEDLEGAPYGYTPMCDSRKEMEGFRFWKKGYWETFLGDEYKYHISALYVVDLIRFRQIAAGDILRHHYQQLSYDPNSLSNLDQDLPNNLQRNIPIHSLSQEWLWCETWCSDESLKDAKTIDLCNNPLTKEPKLDRARRQIKEWTELDNEVSNLIAGRKNQPNSDLEHDEL